MNKVSNWKHNAPKLYYEKCIKMFGEPIYTANVRYGCAKWKVKGLFTEHYLKDEFVPHCVPGNHHDFFYSTIKFHVPQNKLPDVLKISGSILYDGLKKHLTARCATIEANYATLYLGQLVAMGKLDILEVKKNNLYEKMIRGEIIPYFIMKKEMIKEKKKNHKKFKTQLSQKFSNYSFSECKTSN